MKKVLSLALAAMMLVAFASCSNPSQKTVTTVDDPSVKYVAGSESTVYSDEGGYYVDISKGNDSNAGTFDKPFKTLTKAVSVLQPGDKLNVGGGTYSGQIAIPSGTAEKPITVKGIAGQTPVITGNTEINLNWSVYSGNIYVADFANKVDVLYVDNVQQNLARWPNTNVDDLNNMKRATMLSGSDSLHIYDSSLPQNVNLTGARVNMWPGSAYTSFSRLITEYNGGVSLKFNKAVESSGGDPEGFDPFVPKAGNKYYIIDSLSLLDYPGEWYYDSAAQKLYIYTESGDSPANHVVSYQTSKTGINIASQSYINIKNISLFGCAVNGNGAQNCVLDGVNVKYGDYFIDSDGYSSIVNKANILSGSNNIWKNSIISHCAGNGIALGGTNNTVDNCEICYVDWAGGYFGCLLIEGTGHIVKNSTLYNSGRYIVYFRHASQIKILNNDMHTSSLLSGDCGAIYIAGTKGNGTEIAYNYVHDNIEVGIYIDNNCSGMNIHHNISYKNGTGITMNSQFLDSKVVNNTFLRNGKTSNTYCYPAETPSMKASIIKNNLYDRPWNVVTGENAPIMSNNIKTKLETLNADFSLKVGHKAINSGTEVAGYTDGYIGAAPDAGAIEYGIPPFSYFEQHIIAGGILGAIQYGVPPFLYGCSWNK